MASYSVRLEIISLLNAQREYELIPEMAHTESTTELDYWLDVEDFLKAEVDRDFRSPCPPEPNPVPNYVQVPLAEPEVVVDTLPHVFWSPTPWGGGLGDVEGCGPTTETVFQCIEDPYGDHSMGPQTPNVAPQEEQKKEQDLQNQSAQLDAFVNGHDRSPEQNGEPAQDQEILHNLPLNIGPSQAQGLQEKEMGNFLCNFMLMHEMMAQKKRPIKRAGPAPVSMDPAPVSQSTLMDSGRQGARKRKLSEDEGPGSKRPAPTPVSVDPTPAFKTPEFSFLAPPRQSTLQDSNCQGSRKRKLTDDKGPASKRPAPPSKSMAPNPVLEAPTAFSMFRQQQWERLKTELRTRNTMVLDAVLQKRWKDLPKEEKVRYVVQAVKAQMISPSH